MRIMTAGLGTRSRILAAGVAVMSLAVGACGGGAGGDLSGSISVDGSSTVGPITEAVAEEFQGEAPDVQVAVGISGTGGGFEKFCAGEVDIVDASRAIKPEEAEACTKRGVEPIELTVALDGIAVVVNPDVEWADCLTLEQLKVIWNEGSPVKSWEDVDPSFPDADLPLFGPGTDSGTFDFFTKEVNGEEGQSRSDYTPSEDDNVLVRGIEGQSGALGYFGLAYFEQSREKLKDVGLDAGDGKCVRPTNETVQRGTYPLSRPLFIYVSKKAAAREEVKSFVDFYLDAVGDLVPDVGYVVLPQDLLDKAVSTWEDATA